MDLSPFVLTAPSDWNFEQVLRHVPHRSSPVRLSRSHRISKPPSSSNSPKKLAVRRSTLSSGYEPFQRTEVCSPAWPTSTAENESRLQPSSKSRPLSWHPSTHFAQAATASVQPQSYFPDYNTSSPPSLQPFTTTQVNGLITPLAQPCHDEALTIETFPSLDTSQSNDNPYAFLDEFRGEPAWSMSSPFPGLPLESYTSKPLQAHQHPLLQPSVDTAPPSPASVSMGSPLDSPSPLLSKIQSATEELVGMGLYDPPSPFVGPRMDSLMSVGSTLGKGLKLEETFEPPPPEEDDEESQEKDHEVDERMEEVQSPHNMGEAPSGGAVTPSRQQEPKTVNASWI